MKMFGHRLTVLCRIYVQITQDLFWMQFTISDFYNLDGDVVKNTNLIIKSV